MHRSFMLGIVYAFRAVRPMPAALEPAHMGVSTVRHARNRRLAINRLDHLLRQCCIAKSDVVGNRRRVHIPVVTIAAVQQT
jgi:hypothetical protein